MLAVKHWPIQGKLLLLATATAFTALTLGSMAFAWHDAQMIRQAKHQQLSPLANLDEVGPSITSNFWLAATVFVFSIVMTLLLTTKLRTMFTGPIEHLIEMMRRVERSRDYSLRADKFGNDEFGYLCASFNGMLQTVEQVNGELQAARDLLEESMAIRTEELRVAVAATKLANRAKSDFLANMSHEIRTPMTAIFGYLDLISEESGLSENGQEHIQFVRKNGKHLLSLINDILDLTEIQAGRMSVEPVRCSVYQIVSEVVSQMRPLALEKGLKLYAEFQKKVPGEVISDPARLRQILLNLVGNAIKYTESGSVSIDVEASPNANDDRVTFCFSVVDTGIGMTEVDRCRIFEAFTQADESTTRHFGGTGLGLSISQALAELLGGSIAVESTLGQGSCFRLAISALLVGDSFAVEGNVERISPESSSHTQKKEIARLDGTKVLLAEDGIDNQRLISAVLRKAGADMTVVENGKLAYDDILLAVRQGCPYDVVLMDMQMPVMDGYLATTSLRDVGYRGPIVAVTAHAMQGDRQRCLDAGCDDYATKPIDRAGLCALVAKYALPLASNKSEPAATWTARPDLRTEKITTRVY